MNRLALPIFVLFAAGCTLDSHDKNHCVTGADCDPGNSCVASVCVSSSSLGRNDGGQCSESFPPASCQAPAPTWATPTATALEKALPGRWLFCGTDTVSVKFGPADAVGLQFNADKSWSFVFADSNGVASSGTGAGEHGPVYEVTTNTGINGEPQIDVALDTTDSQTYHLWTEVAESPARLRMVNLGGGVNVYVWAPAPNCGPADMASPSCGAGHDMAPGFGLDMAPDLASPPDMTRLPDLSLFPGFDAAMQ